ncbi:hypothetical protein Ade02nite_75960 [Paractinoplanes deccanensis]|uniref:Uncharacterized protein n=1 Tax=Paractinoplanes deccanensis TaxID=113561 RepID=A0ABQ3YGB6_9ACTN|nr:hypothetical protein Ade02nite_75960 [Actinoplanes deccanensis]
MTTPDVRADASQRLCHLLDEDPERIADFLHRNRERRERIARIVRREEAENAEFYRELGDR